MTHETISTKLTLLLTDTLPGTKAQLALAPEGRRLDVDDSRYRHAAVLVALHQREGVWGFPLIVRVVDEYVHSGQIGLPGGRLEEGEELDACALRESEEEIGLPAGAVELVGKLTPLPVPVSHHLIHPFVGITGDDVSLTPDPREVEDILFMPVAELLADDARREGDVMAGRTRIRRVPLFELGEHRIWGATGMILAELRELLKQVF
ncbi:CoA pyrophosphatase [bacterium]|nr:CoA pyrophosphatase [bacterium]